MAGTHRQVGEESEVAEEDAEKQELSQPHRPPLLAHVGPQQLVQDVDLKDDHSQDTQARQHTCQGHKSQVTVTINRSPKYLSWAQITGNCDYQQDAYITKHLLWAQMTGNCDHQQDAYITKHLAWAQMTGNCDYQQITQTPVMGKSHR